MKFLYNFMKRKLIPKHLTGPVNLYSDNKAVEEPISKFTKVYEARIIGNTVQCLIGDDVKQYWEDYYAGAVLTADELNAVKLSKGNVTIAALNKIMNAGGIAEVGIKFKSFYPNARIKSVNDL